MFSVRKLLVFLNIFQTPYTFKSGKNGAFSNPPDVKELCPYTSFCGANSSLLFPGSDDEIPCCHDCSCDPSCGLQNNCCFKHLDTFNIEETYQMICKSLYVTMNLPDHLKNIYAVALEPHFRMIDKCLEYKEIPKVYDAFNPVYSSNTKFIYVNEQIAKCNNVKDIIYSQKAIICSLQDVFPAEPSRIIQREEPNADCVIKFIFPEDIDLKSEYCEPEVIRKCNVTGEVTTWQPFWPFCETLNATFILYLSTRNIAYGNIYCYMCNQFYEESRVFSKYRCNATRFPNKNIEEEHTLTMMLRFGFQVDVEDEIEISSTEKDCPVNHAMIYSFSNTCRPIKCPFWKVLIKGKCEYYSNQWIGGDFVTILRLKPREGNLKILRSFLDNISENYNSLRVAKWLKRDTLKQWSIKAFYHPSVNDSFIDFFVIFAKCPFHSVDPNYIEKQVTATLKDTWYITQNKVKIALKIEFNEFQAYLEFFEFSGKILFPEEDQLGLLKHQNISLNTVHVPEALINEHVEGEIARDIADEILYKISGQFWNLKSEIFITDLFFCKQVDLLPDEFEDHNETIFFKVKNITIRNFRRVNDNAYARLSESNSSMIAQSVRICLQEFRYSHIFANAKRSFVFNSFMISTAIIAGIYAMDLD